MRYNPFSFCLNIGPINHVFILLTQNIVYYDEPDGHGRGEVRMIIALFLSEVDMPHCLISH